MRGLKTIVVGGIAAFLVVAVLAVPTFAQSTETTTEETTTNTRRETAQQRVQELRCTKAEARIQAISDRLETVKTNRSQMFTGVIARVDSIIGNASESGYESTELTDARARVQSSYDSFVVALETYQTSIDSTESFACGEATSPYTSALAKSKADIVAVRTAAESFRNEVKTSLIPALREYAMWLKDTVETPSNDTPASNTEESTTGEAN